MPDHGISGVWAGNRARRELVQKFFPGTPPTGTTNDILTAAGDKRALFYAKDRTLEISNTDAIKDFKKGYSVVKFTGIKSDGSPVTDTGHADTDFFFFRVAESYLAYAEATARLNGGNATTQGIAYLNELRKRSGAAELRGFSLREILNERSREFYFEGQRRTDLIRYGYFGGDNTYMWSWKGGTPNGRTFDVRRNIFPLPASDLSVNPNLKQNPGY